jgi:Na+-driven multidrug efflux pump
MGILLQRGILIGCVMSAPIIVAWFNANSILVMLGQDPKIAELAAVYLPALSPAMLSGQVTECFKKYQMAQVRSCWCTTFTEDEFFRLV